MKDTAQHIGIFSVFENPGYTTEELRTAQLSGVRLEDMPGIKWVASYNNLLMASQKLKMAQAVYPNIDRLVITSQTTAPADNETAYTGVIYTSTPADEFSRNDNQNPAIIQWNITAEAANGPWGSFILIDSTGNMINRALAGITKASNTNKIIQFTGRVV